MDEGTVDLSRACLAERRSLTVALLMRVWWLLTGRLRCAVYSPPSAADALVALLFGLLFRSRATVLLRFLDAL